MDTKHSRPSINRVAKMLSTALTRMLLDYRYTRAKSSSSIYFRIKHRNGINFAHVRIANHPRTDSTDTSAYTNKADCAIEINIGYKPWADYDLADWYLALQKIASRTACIESSKMASRIIAEEKAKKYVQPDAFNAVQKNIHKKATRKALMRRTLGKKKRKMLEDKWREEDLEEMKCAEL